MIGCRKSGKKAARGVEPVERVGVPIVLAERDDVFDRVLAVGFRPDVLNEGAPGPHIETLAAQANAEDGEVAAFEQGPELFVLVSAEEVEDERELEIVTDGIADLGHQSHLLAVELGGDVRAPEEDDAGALHEDLLELRGAAVLGEDRFGESDLEIG